jgi:asparagine synthase (glutamine-hydrolysing)
VRETILQRQKHAFTNPPSTLDVKGRFFSLMADTLKGPAVQDLGFFDRRKVMDLVDCVPAMSKEERIVVDSILLTILSACILKDRFRIAT